MANVTFTGKTPITRSQVDQVIVDGTFSGETFTLSIDGVQVAAYTHSGSDTEVEIIAGLKASFDSSSKIEALKRTATDNGNGTLNITARTQGEPFVLTYNNPGGSANLTHTPIFSSSGPSDLNLAANYADAALVTSGDSLKIVSSSAVLYGLDQSTVPLASLEIAGTGAVGLPEAPIQIDLADSSDVNINTTGVTYLKLADDSNVCPDSVNIIVEQTATPTVGYGFYLETGGTNPIDSITVKRGFVAISEKLSDTTTNITQINQGYVTNQETDTKILVGNDIAGLTTYNKSGGSAILLSSCTTVRQNGGTMTIAEGAAVTTLYCLGGTVYLNSGETIGTAYVGKGAVLDLTKSAIAKTISSLILLGGTVKYDSNITTLTSIVGAGTLDDVQIPTGAYS